MHVRGKYPTPHRKFDCRGHSYISTNSSDENPGRRTLAVLHACTLDAGLFNVMQFVQVSQVRFAARCQMYCAVARQAQSNAVDSQKSYQFVQVLYIVCNATLADNALRILVEMLPYPLYFCAPSRVSLPELKVVKAVTKKLL